MKQQKSRQAQAVAASVRHNRLVVLCGAMILLALILAACDRREDRLPFDGQFFRSDTKVIDKNKEHISVTVRPVSASLQGAREAGLYEATRYCIENYGTSNIEWVASPDAEEENLAIEKDTLTLEGMCAP